MHSGHGVGELSPLSLYPATPTPDYDERSHLHDSFSQMIHSLQEAAAAQGESWGRCGGKCGLGALRVAFLGGEGGTAQDLDKGLGKPLPEAP